MEYAKFGNGPRPLVIIPGLAIKSVMKSASSLQVPYKMFTEDFTLYFFDRRKDVDPGYSLEEMARDQVLAMQALGLKDVALLYGQRVFSVDVGNRAMIGPLDHYGRPDQRNVIVVADQPGDFLLRIQRPSQNQEE